MANNNEHVTWICACGNICKPPIEKCIICQRRFDDTEEEKQRLTEKFQKHLK